MRLTRRDVLTSTGTVIAFLSGVSRASASFISYTVRNTYNVFTGSVRRPNQYSYDMYEFNGSENEWGVLEFQGWDYAEFGNERTPPNKPETGIPFDLNGVNVDLPTTDSIPLSLDLRSQISLPYSFSLYSMNIGVAITLVGLHGVLLAGVHLFKNYAAGIAWGIALVLLILSGLLDIGLELYWLSIVLTVVLLISGLVVRWSR